MDTPDVYADPLGDALSYSSQRLAQLGSLITAAATVEARRRAQAQAARAARDERALSALRDQERTAWQLARAGWAPAHDSRWLAQSDLLQTARVWSAAVAYAEADPTAGSAVRRCEERLRALHPYAMAWYDRLRGEGTGAIEAMHMAVPLFGRAPHVRSGDPGTQRHALEFDALSPDPAAAETASAHAPGDRTAAQLAAESFPYTAADTVEGAAMVSRVTVRRMAVQDVRRLGRSV
jgi:hypothetical protein